MESIKRLRAVKGVRVLLSSWDDPRRGDDAVLGVAKGEPSIDPMELCAGVCSALGLPAWAANPLTARSLKSHLPLLDRKNLF
jgi:hypothetical protein